MTFEAGTTVEAKRSNGLGGWQRAVVVRRDPSGALGVVRYIVRLGDGTEHNLPASRVRAQRDRGRPGPKPGTVTSAYPFKGKRACSYCGSKSHNIKRCPKVPQTPAEKRVAVAEALRELGIGPPKPRPKNPPKRSALFLAFVRTHPCCACGEPNNIEAHHFGPRGMGQKTDDYRAAPLCSRCHEEFHRRGILRYATPMSLDAYGSRADEIRRVYTERLLYRTQVDLLVAWTEAAWAAWTEAL